MFICRWKHASVARERQICAMCRDGGMSSLISCHCTGDAKFCVSTGWRGNYVRTVCAHYFCSSPYYIYYLTLLYILSHLIIYIISPYYIYDSSHVVRPFPCFVTSSSVAYFCNTVSRCVRHQREIWMRSGCRFCLKPLPQVFFTGERVIFPLYDPVFRKQTLNLSQNPVFIIKKSRKACIVL